MIDPWSWRSCVHKEYPNKIEPLTSVAIAKDCRLAAKLTAPIRVGEHSHTAFAFGLMLDWARLRSGLILFCWSGVDPT